MQAGERVAGGVQLGVIDLVVATDSEQFRIPAGIRAQRDRLHGSSRNRNVAAQRIAGRVELGHGDLAIRVNGEEQRQSGSIIARHDRLHRSRLDQEEAAVIAGGVEDRGIHLMVGEADAKDLESRALQSGHRNGRELVGRDLVIAAGRVAARIEAPSVDGMIGAEHEGDRGLPDKRRLDRADGDTLVRNNAGRGKPRSSVVGAPVLTPLPIARLLDIGNSVCKTCCFRGRAGRRPLLTAPFSGKRLGGPNRSVGDVRPGTPGAPKEVAAAIG